MKKYELNEYRFLGLLCIYEHRYKDTDQTLRYLSKPHGCVVCNAESSEKRRKAGKVKAWREANPDTVLAYRARYKDEERYRRKKYVRKQGK